MFKKVLIANRGEIALRIMRTAAEMGMRTVAVYSDVDKASLHVAAADEAVALGDPEPASSYLNIDKIISAAHATGCEAIHPGYGFLSENPVFANRVASEGLTFIGPPGSVMADLGDKTKAREIMSGGGVPVIPGMIESSDDPARLLETARALGYPVLVKAAAGGGGKGMRIVFDPEELPDAARSASSEAATAFGDGRIYLEKYLDRPRHVEFQIVGDSHGNLIHLFERECSIQRRHQKIIEETPSTALDDDLRGRMAEAALAAGKAAGYVNAGTVEFLLDSSGRFYFLEVNTRLQVEHPITEMTTGVDLVRLQMRVAAKEPLPMTQKDIAKRGHSIECRIYTEDPESNFMPTPGRILYAKPPEGPGIRFDHAIYSGFEVPVHYDPILGKLVVWAEDRPAAIARMIRALKECVILGVKTQIEFLLDVLSSDAFRRGDIHTHLIDDEFAGWQVNKDIDALAAVACVGYEMARPRTAARLQEGSEKIGLPSPWQTLGSWDFCR
ncbi:MAG: acetyl-CoA carboxylase biotin carboxylase subunit [Desulfomonilaceae bacterium]